MLTAAMLVLAGTTIGGLLLMSRLLAARAWRESLVELELRLPLGLTTEDIHRWLNTVAAATQNPRFSFVPDRPVVLEVVADSAGVRHLVLLPQALRPAVLSGLRAALPGVRVEDTPEYL